MNTDAATLITIAVASLITLTIAVALVASIIRIVSADGYGRNPAPASHRSDWGTTTAPSTPYRNRLA